MDARPIIGMGIDMIIARVANTAALNYAMDRPDGKRWTGARDETRASRW